MYSSCSFHASIFSGILITMGMKRIHNLCFACNLCFALLSSSVCISLFPVSLSHAQSSPCFPLH